VVKLAHAMVDEVRRRVQQDTRGHRGHAGDSLYEARRLLRTGAEKLTDRHRARLENALAAGDPDRGVTLAWRLAQHVRAIYHAPTPAQGRALADRLLRCLPCPIPEAARFGRTLRSWRGELLAYFDTGGASNGPTEAINLLIEKLRRAAHGFRNFANYRLRLLLHSGVTRDTVSNPRIRSHRPRMAG
jgi:transposase